MATVLPESTSTSVSLTRETSLADIKRARENGLGMRETAELFAEGLVQYQQCGHNLYGRQLLEATDAENWVEYPDHFGPRRMIMLASNNYLGLATHPRVIQAAQRAAASFGVGAGSAPLLVGSFPTTSVLEEKLAAFKGTEAACVFASGYAANVGVMSTAVRKGDVVILDRLAHASMIDGARLSGASVKVFQHNDAEHLDRILSRCGDANDKLVAVEGIYSMDGDVAPLDELVEVAKKHGAMVLVDEAHSTGVLGPEGRGAVAEFGLDEEVDFHLGTLSKALGTCGGFVAGKAAVITYLRYFARSAMFSTAPSPMVLAAASAALDVIADEPELRTRLWENCHYLYGRLQALGFQLGPAPSPIIPVIVGCMSKLREITLELHQHDLCVNSVPYPAVAAGSERLRLSVTSSHTTEQLDRAVQILEKIGRQAGIIA